MELSLALNHRLRQERQAAGKKGADCTVELLTSGQILPSHTPAARRKFLRIAKVSALLPTRQPNLSFWHMTHTI